MRVFEGHRELSDGFGPVILSIGTFDGLHVGHRAIVERIVDRARKTGVPSMVYSFYPPPWRLLGRGEHPFLILTLRDKIELLAGMGVDLLLTEPFTAELQEVEATAFAEMLRTRLRPREIHVGYDFRFGRGRQGDAGLLAAHFADTGTEIRPHGAVRVDGEIVGCTAIRRQIVGGAVTDAAKCLGRFHRVRGTVVHGDGRGRTIGFPTANVAPETELLPGNGVYAVTLAVGDRPAVEAVANLGTRPTFDGTRRALEVHALSPVGDLYGKDVVVRFVGRIRDERRFESKDSLVAQIETDVAAVRSMLPFPEPPRGSLSWDPKPEGAP